MTPQRHTRWLGWAAAMAVAAMVFWVLPPLRVVRLSATRHQAAGAAFDAEAFVEKFWRDQLLNPDTPALEANRLVQLLRENPAAAAELGRRLGFSRNTSYFIRGAGRVAAVVPDAVSLFLEGDREEVSVVIETGPVFGNAIRDGSGLLDVNLFPNSQDFNAISGALNRRVEAEVLPHLKAQAAVGRRINFIGGVEVGDPAHALPLRVVPVRIEVP
ncbi:MAG TPA: DUF2291 family protein [Candidatus Paceibacterota bacterium]|nr:DUF2291 family protein [Candidatus Paceibacterota bacterium]